MNRYRFLKFLLIIFVLSWEYSLRAQQIPEFESNISDTERINSFVFNKIKLNYDQLISYTTECYWSKEQHFYVLVNSRDKWNAFRFRIKFKDHDNKTSENIHSIDRIKLSISNSKIEGLFKYWSQINFWNLCEDSLTYRFREVDGKKIFYLGTTDGCTDKFEISAKNKFKVYEVDNNEELQAHVPIQQREQFILGRDKYLELVKRK